ncbi:MAG TPA: hypothetical protein VFR85_01785 [Anaeromyxobacteraceae bacterium]|nr:hypothetical protein [Anaeromyxobacteraceae bacterium]
MKVTQTLRLVLGAAALAAAVAVLWWIVGFALGKSALEQSGAGAAFSRIYAFREESLLPLLALALLSYLGRLVGAEAGGGAGAGRSEGGRSEGARWLRLAVLGAAAALIFGGAKFQSAEVGWVLFVFAAAAAAESSGVQGLLVALVAGAFVAFAFVIDKDDFGTGQKLIVMALRDVFYLVPLLVGPEWLDKWMWRGQK